MLPFFHDVYGNPGSVNHVFGWESSASVKEARQSIAQLINATPKEIVFTSGATESNNLAIRGVVERKRRRGSHVVTLKTEHHAVLDPLRQLQKEGFRLNFFEI